MHNDVVKQGARIVRAMATLVVLGVGGSAMAEDLLGELRGYVLNYETVMQGVANDADLCPNMVSDLRRKIDRAPDASDRATYRDYLKTAEKCVMKLKQVVRTGTPLNRRCAGVLEDLEDVDGAPDGSNAARRSASVRKAARACVKDFEKWGGVLQDFQELLNEAVVILPYT